MYNDAIARYLRKHGFEALRPKAVLFDMDGVLYDSMPHHAVAWQQSMQKFGITMTAEDAYATEGQRGVDTIRQMVRQQQGREIGEEEAQTMYDEKSRLFHLMPESPIMPSALRLMGKLQRQGLTVGVVTGSGQRPLIARLLRDFGQYVSRNHIVTAYDVKQGKPHPDPYLQGLAKMGGLQPWEAIVVENAPMGVEAAVAARIFTICINTGHLPAATLTAKAPDVLLDSMTALATEWKAFPFSPHSISHDERWDYMFMRVSAFITAHRRNPSKYKAEERDMLNWIKSNRRKAAQGRLPAYRQERFDRIINLMSTWRRVNQYEYTDVSRGEQLLFDM